MLSQLFLESEMSFLVVLTISVVLLVVIWLGYTIYHEFTGHKQ